MKRTLLSLILCVAWGGIASAAVYFNNSEGDNDFSNDLNWSGTIGTTGGDAVDVSGADQAKLLTGQTESRPIKLWLGFNTGKTGEMTVDGGDLTCGQFLEVGYKGTGTFHLDAGSVQTTTYDINLGVLSGSHGTLNMSGGTMTADRDLYIGEAGTGVMTVSSGTVTTTDDDIALGTTSTGNGTLTVSGGSVTAKDMLNVAEDGTGTLNVNGGSVKNINHDINVAEGSTGSGTITMTGGLLTADRFFHMGEYGTGVMNMYGGTNAVTDYDFILAKYAGSSGTLTMTNGHMDITRDFVVGEAGDGVMTMSGGTINAGGIFRVAEISGSSGQLNFSGGTINADIFLIGSGTKTAGMVAFSETAQMILNGNETSRINGYINDGWITGAEVTYVSSNDTTVVGQAAPEPPPEQLPAGMLARFDFENLTAGDLIPGTDPDARPLANRGSSFSYTSNGADSNTTLSVLNEFGPGDLDDNYGVYVCEDTLHNNEPGGKFIAISPWRLSTRGEGDMSPTNSSVDTFQFSIQAESNLLVSLDSFSFDMASYMVTNNIEGVSTSLVFRAQAWYAVPEAGVTNWVKLQETQVLSTSTAQDWVGFSNVSVDLSGIPALQGVADEILIALAVSDNNNRVTQNLEEGAAEYYMDNINLYGTVAEVSEEVLIEIGSDELILTWASSSSYNYNVLTNQDLVSGEWGIYDTVPGLGGVMSWTSAVPEVEHVFYKLDITQ